MMYRHATNGSQNNRRRRSAAKRLSTLLAIVGVGVLLLTMYAFVWSRPDEVGTRSMLSVYSKAKWKDYVHRNRIDKDAIPYVDYRSMNIREMFNDSNYVHLSAAKVNGIDPDKITDPSACDALVPIFSTELYQVDTMYHSTPYLVPEAVLLLEYIAERFSELMDEHYKKFGKYKIVVTSALRTEQSERNLRRVNRNATDTSCHIYGTTFDLSAQRYEHVASGRDTVEEMCKQMLALALYELHYEGLCYVKYERGSCFHITLRTTQYEGDGKSQMCKYINPGSPDYLETKAPERPKPRNVEPAQTVRTKPVTKRQKHSENSVRKDVKTHNKTTHVQESRSGITERERLSLEQFEKRY